jgi:cell wall-associated NlpC family hydrolase
MLKIKFISIFLLLIVLVGCKPTQSVIVTNKDEALKKGIYSSPVAEKKSTVAKTTKTVKPIVEPSKKEKNTSKKSLLNETDDTVYSDNNDVSYYIKQLINNAMQYNGVRYRGGGTTTEGMDCSGLVTTVFKTYDISLPRSSFDMAKVGKKLDRSDIQVGDLVFFKTNGRKVINHVGLVTEIKGDEIIFIHSTTQRGVILSSTKEPYYQRTFAQANRVLSEDYF